MLRKAASRLLLKPRRRFCQGSDTTPFDFELSQEAMDREMAALLEKIYHDHPAAFDDRDQLHAARARWRFINRNFGSECEVPEVFVLSHEYKGLDVTILGLPPEMGGEPGEIIGQLEQFTGDTVVLGQVAPDRWPGLAEAHQEVLRLRGVGARNLSFAALAAKQSLLSHFKSQMESSVFFTKDAGNVIADVDFQSTLLVRETAANCAYAACQLRNVKLLFGQAPSHLRLEDWALRLSLEELQTAFKTTLFELDKLLRDSDSDIQHTQAKLALSIRGYFAANVGNMFFQKDVDFLLAVLDALVDSTNRRVLLIVDEHLVRDLSIQM